ncbi:hypothetical protein F4802DRAFT_613994 [Xylaria palmicola]|nr:hypothetical protein F4802DRAFT_613994 [Xylaria palmicola]
MAAEAISAAARADAPISSAELIGVVTLYIAISTVFTVARVYTRFFIHQQLWWDDWTMFLAWLGTIALCTIQLLMLQHGAGVNIWELWLDIQMVARIAIFFARLSILLLYIRIFFPIGTARSIFWWIIQAVIWLNVLYSVSLILVLTLQCVPYHLPWGNSCVNQYLVLVLASVINIISDIAVLAIPIASVMRLRTTRKKKWAIWALFAFGTLAPLASVARLGYQVPLASGENKTVIYPIVLLLATAEQAVAMIVGSAPVASGAVIRVLRRKKRPAPGAGGPAAPRHHNRRPRNKTVSERFWPSREATSEYFVSAGKAGGEVPDMLHISVPSALLTESAKRAKGRRSDGGDGEDSWKAVAQEISHASQADSRMSYV